MTRIVIADTDAQRTCRHWTFTVIERAGWDEQLCALCRAVIWAVPFDEADAAEFYRLAQEEGLNPEIA